MDAPSAWLWADSNKPKFHPVLKELQHDMGSLESKAFWEIKEDVLSSLSRDHICAQRREDLSQSRRRSGIHRSRSSYGPKCWNLSVSELGGYAPACVFAIDGGHSPTFRVRVLQ